MIRKLRTGDIVTVFGPVNARGRVLATKAHGTIVTVKLNGSGAKGTRERRHPRHFDWLSMSIGDAEMTRARAARPPARHPRAATKKAARRTKASRAAAAGGPGHDRRGAR